MIEEIVQAVVLLGLIASAVAVWRFRDLIAAAVSFGAFSFLLSLEFYLLQAPDVAIAEAAIGAGLTTAIYIAAIRATERTEEGSG